MSLNSSCPVCAASSVVLLTPVTIPPRKPSHRCSQCGAALVTRLNPKAWTSVATGVLLTLAVYALYEFAASVEVLSSNARALVAVIALGAAYGFAANRVLRAMEFVVWSQTP